MRQATTPAQDARAWVSALNAWFRGLQLWAACNRADMGVSLRLGFGACDIALRAIGQVSVLQRSGGCPVRHAKRTNECVFYPDVVRPTARWPHHLCFGGFAESRPSGRSSCRGRTTFSLAASPNGRLGVLMAVVVFQLVKACDFPVFSASPGVFDSTRASFEQQAG